MSALELFHFLRPLWLAALPLVALTWWAVRRRGAKRTNVADFVAPHLRDALTVNRSRQQRLRAADGVALGLVAAAIAAAGPTWSKQQSPWLTETAPLIVAIEVSDSMRSNDLPPSRLDRARFKVLDLMERRTGSRTALIAYAGSAHIVMPPSADPDVVKPFLESLDPAIMPEPGADVSRVLPLAEAMLADDGAGATLLFVNDGFAPTDIAALVEYSARTEAPSMLALVLGTEEGGVALMPDGSVATGPAGGPLDTTVDTAVQRRVQSEAGVPIVRAAAGDADLRRLLRHIESSLRQAEDADAQWRDQAWWFVWPTALLTLFWFRRGWTMRW